MNHAQLQKAVTGLCDELGLWWHHEANSRRSKAGWVDLVILGWGGALFAEIKTEDGRRTSKQIECAKQLTRAYLQYRLWRPSDYTSGEIRNELEAIAWK
jgi:hypothetical protein